MSDRGLAHARLRAGVLLQFGAQPWLRLFPRVVARTEVDGRWITAGVKGQADLYGWITEGPQAGRHVEIELKTGSARLTKQQRVWGALCEQTGCLYMIARSVDDVARRFAEEGYTVAPRGSARRHPTRLGADPAPR